MNSKVLRRLILSFVTVLFLTSGLHADVTFNSAKNLFIDAQVIRLKALGMGWKVNKPFSFVAAVVILGKDLVYPKAEVEISLREAGGQLQIRAQVVSEDAGKADWHNIHADKIKTSPPFKPM